jgi:serine/threonine protein kinase
MQNIFAQVSPLFYETLARHQLSLDYVQQLKQLLPAEWILRRDGIWMHGLSPAGAGRSAFPIVQGFKIHVSSAPAHASRTLEVVVPILVAAGVDFKIAGDPALLHILNSKSHTRGGSGKFMTIYPTDQGSFQSLIELLHERTRHEKIAGAYILSDRRYKDSKILFYRYGGFHSPMRVNIDGTQTPLLVSPSGKHIPDERSPYFQLPDWVSDPFGNLLSSEGELGILLNGRYLIEEALKFSNSGGVYSGTDTATGQPIIVKEARPLTNCWGSGHQTCDATDLLRHEYDVLRCLQGLAFIPSSIDLFNEWEHTFLVEERVKGITLNQYCASNDVIIAPYIRRSDQLDRWKPKFKHVAKTLIEMIAAVHGRGVVLGDLSMRNVLVDPDSLGLSLIDFESAVQVDTSGAILQFARQWGTAGFIDPARASRGRPGPEDDWYAIAMILYGCVVPVNALFDLNPSAAAIFLERFIELGIPRQVKNIIDSLVRSDKDAALDILASWDCESSFSRQDNLGFTPALSSNFSSEMPHTHQGDC